MGYLFLITLFALGVACYRIQVWKSRVIDEQNNNAEMYNDAIESARAEQNAINQLEYLQGTIAMMMERPVYALLTDAQIQQIAAHVNNADKKEYLN